jgi:hypothetical protein
MSGNPFRQVAKRAAQSANEKAGNPIGNLFTIGLGSIAAIGGVGILGFLGYDALFNGPSRSARLSRLDRKNATFIFRFSPLGALPIRLFLYFCLLFSNLVQGGYAAIKFNKLFGVVDTVYGPGTHIKWPFFENAILFEARAKPRAIPTLTGSKGANTSQKN